MAYLQELDVLTVGGAIVGFIGLIGAVRTLNGKSGLVCNLTLVVRATAASRMEQRVDRSCYPL